MPRFTYLFVFFSLLSCSFWCNESMAQESIKWNGIRINRLDKQNRKQGDWIYFNEFKQPVIACQYKDDQIAGPTVFFEHSDTSFVILPVQDSLETFVLFHNGKIIEGDFVHRSNGKIAIALNEVFLKDELVVSKINHYKNFELKPVFYFGQEKLTDHLYAKYAMANLASNETIQAVLEVNAAGQVSNVRFPKTEHKLYETATRELTWIYTSLPRWQPCFKRNAAISSEVVLNNDALIGYQPVVGL